MNTASGGDDHSKDSGLTVVPEPATVLMLTFGALALVAQHRGKR